MSGPFPDEPTAPTGGPCADAHVNCEEALRHVQDVLDGHGDPELLVGWSTHLVDCPPCGAELEIYERLRTALRSQQSCCPDDVSARLAEFGRRLCTEDGPTA